MKLSILMPSIRTENWDLIYNSISKSFKGKWELIIITPDKRNKLEKENVKIIYSKKSPVSCQQLGLIASSGEWITSLSDDGQYLEGMLDYAMNIAIKRKNKIIVMKYTEGNELGMGEFYSHRLRKNVFFTTNWDFMKSDEYYYLENHKDCQLPYMPKPSPVLSTAIMRRSSLVDIGGWDCNFETLGIGNCELAGRLMLSGIEFDVADKLISFNGFDGSTGNSHGAIHAAMLENDKPLLTRTFSKKLADINIYLSIENHTKTPIKWERRG